MTRTDLSPLTRHPVTSVLVALDGSAFAERAIAPARRFAARLGVPVSPLPVDQALEAVTAADDRDGHPLLCLATHGRSRSAVFIPSTAAGLLAASEGPVLLVGPAVPADPPSSGRLAVCVDGSADSEQIMAAAACWACALDLSVTAFTVAEPVPASVRRPDFYPRLHGPHSDADVYMRDLAAAWSGAVTVTGRALYDPVDVGGALVDAFIADPPDLVVMGTRAPRGLRRMILGSTAADVAHRSPAPVLAFPV